MQKKVWTWQASSPGSWVLTDVRKFVWSGWLMLLALNGLAGGGGGTGLQPVRKYTWGLDLAGLGGAQTSGLRGGDAGHGGPTLQGAGGIKAGSLKVAVRTSGRDAHSPHLTGQVQAPRVTTHDRITRWRDAGDTCEQQVAGEEVRLSGRHGDSPITERARPDSRCL